MPAAEVTPITRFEAAWRSRILFTGIIEEVGTILNLRRQSSGGVLVVGAEAVTDGLKPGDSVAVNGACLTVTEASPRSLTCDLSSETLERSTFGRQREGARVNLERSLAVGSRFGGHFVLGHVDRVGRLLSRSPSGGGWLFSFEFPTELAPYFVSKGSAAVDGISLTVASITETTFAVAVIPILLSIQTSAN
jgi:riboflavin synthase